MTLLSPQKGKEVQLIGSQHVTCTGTPPTVNHYAAAVTHNLGAEPSVLALDCVQHQRKAGPSPSQAEESQEVGK